MKKISIVILTYNAHRFVKHTLDTLSKTEYENKEIIVFDNDSDEQTKRLLTKYKKEGIIDKLVFSKENLMFIRGNNEAVKYCDKNTDYVLLLNADVEIKNKYWLQALCNVHTRGITATDRSSTVDNRPDGWCVLIDYDLYCKYELDEKKFDVFWSVSDLGAKVQNDGEVQTIVHYDNFIKHFGHASGPFKSDFKKDMCVSEEDVHDWFKRPCSLIDRLTVDPKGRLSNNYLFYIYNYTRKVVRKIKRLTLEREKGV